MIRLIHAMPLMLYHKFDDLTWEIIGAGLQRLGACGCRDCARREVAIQGLDFQGELLGRWNRWCVAQEDVKARGLGFLGGEILGFPMKCSICPE